MIESDLDPLQMMISDIVTRVAASAQLGWAITREAGASVLAYELYPLGIARNSIPVLPPLRSPVMPRPIPVLFLHGIFHNPSTFAWLKTRLTWAGHRSFKELNLFTSFRSIPYNAEYIRGMVERMKTEMNVPHVDILAHSMGGILARYYIQMMGGDGSVRYLVTLGTPHQGAPLSRFAVLPHLRELTPESKTMAALNSTAPPRATQGVAISGDLDLFVRPRAAGHWKGARNYHLKHVGHAGLLFSRRVAQIVVSHLSNDLDDPLAKSARA